MRSKPTTEEPSHQPRMSECGLVRHFYHFSHFAVFVILLHVNNFAHSREMLSLIGPEPENRAR
jgi:hypothetical protein